MGRSFLYHNQTMNACINLMLIISEDIYNIFLTELAKTTENKGKPQIQGIPYLIAIITG